MTESEAIWRLDGDYHDSATVEAKGALGQAPCLDAVCPACDSRGLEFMPRPHTTKPGTRVFCWHCGRAHED
jgi:hypothetical protein